MIIYFTGTGNSLTTARILAGSLDDEAFHINEAVDMDPSQEKIIGLVYPCYYNDMPNAVKDFVKKFKFNKTTYIFGILTHGGDPGNSIHTFQALLAEKGLDLSYGNDILMPVNSRIMYGRVTTDIQIRVKNQKKIVKRFTSDVSSRRKNSTGFKKKMVPAIMSNLSNSSLGKRLVMKKVDSDRCIQCGTCVKVCSLKNIKIKKDKVLIGKSCTDCLACMHWCPKAAIGFGRRNVKREQQYHHPNVKLKDIILQEQQ